MKPLLVTQRVVEDANHKERRDALDQRWAQFLVEAGLLAIPAPNHLRSIQELVSEIRFGGILLTGGGDLVNYGGDTPERDAVETFLLEYAIRNNVPVMGVCRGMQSIQSYFQIRLEKVEGHVTPTQSIQVHGRRRNVNSYHQWGSRDLHSSFDVWASAEDGVVEGIRHLQHPIKGIMWHPERLTPFHSEDLILFQRHFSEGI